MSNPEHEINLQADRAADAMIGAWLDSRADIDAPLTPADLAVLHTLTARQLARWHARGARISEDQAVSLRQLLGRIIQAARRGDMSELAALLNRADIIMIAGQPAAFLGDDKNGEVV